MIWEFTTRILLDYGFILRIDDEDDDDDDEEEEEEEGMGRVSGLMMLWRVGIGPRIMSK